MHFIIRSIILASFLLSLPVFSPNAFAEILQETHISTNVTGSSMSPDGIGFTCDANRLRHIKKGMVAYLDALGISRHLVIIKMNPANSLLTFTLNTQPDETDTLQLSDNPKYNIRDHIAYLPGNDGNLQKVMTVSQKEILLALMQHGRLTEFSGTDCSMNALKDHVRVRQNIVAWSENLNWYWPDGEAAEWNTKYWRKGTPVANVTLDAALADAFHHQQEYSIGCYTAAKLVMAHGVLDYYRRVKDDKSGARLIRNRLLSDGEPLVNIEPEEMWSFENDFIWQKNMHPGKILAIQYNVAPKNFVPGDWIYIINTDARSAAKTGYEGSNTIYLGRNKFVDYYNDHHHGYTYQQKLNEVYQWRHGVFNRYRDAEKAQPLSDEDFENLGKSPENGGFVMGFRVFPVKAP